MSGYCLAQTLAQRSLLLPQQEEPMDWNEMKQGQNICVFLGCRGKTRCLLFISSLLSPTGPQQLPAPSPTLLALPLHPIIFPVTATTLNLTFQFPPLTRRLRCTSPIFSAEISHWISALHLDIDLDKTELLFLPQRSFTGPVHHC